MKKEKDMFKRVLTIVIVLLWSGWAFAAHPLITDDTGTQGKGKFQLEVNSEFTKEKEQQYNSDEDKWETKKETGGELATVLSYGITDNVDIVLGLPYQWK
ncbi:MAG TPA: transporter, partial [Nitrospiraceae bacterium]|nr:transporter [Nitrospiraceae bacterium]